MIDDVSDIAELYNRDAEREHNRLERHQLEFDLTWRYLERYLPSQGSILEIGAATGRYTLGLAQRGYQVTAVDLSSAEIKLCEKNLAVAGLEKNVQCIVADARDLSQVTKRDYDAVLLMGPLYHLVVEADRKTALKEASDRLVEGGTLFTAFISRLGIMGDLMEDTPEWIEQVESVRSVLDYGKDPDDYPKGGFRGYFARADEISPLVESAGFDTLVLAGVEPAISANDENYNILEGKRRQLWLDILFEISTDPSIVGSSRHLLHIGKKNK